MRKIKKVIAAMAVAALVSGCGAVPFNFPALLATATAAPTYTAVLPSPTLTAAATYTPLVPSPTQPSPTFTPIPTFTATVTATSPTPTLPLGTTATQTLTFTPGPAGTALGYGNITLVLPGSLGTDTTNTTSTDVEFPFTNASFGDMPQHIRLVISGYPLQGTALQPQIMVFPATRYAQYSDYTERIIDALQSTQYLDGQPLPEGLPDGPFNAHVHSVQFANGHGIRYLTQFDQAVLPVNNRELIYYFHGLTDSGDSYVEAILPIHAPILAADDDPNSPLPQGGIPFDMNDPGTYFRDVANQLNATPPDDLTPTLSTLDALIQSIYISPAQ